MAIPGVAQCWTACIRSFLVSVLQHRSEKLDKQVERLGAKGDGMDRSIRGFAWRVKEIWARLGAVGVERSASINRSGSMGIPKLRQAAALHGIRGFAWRVKEIWARLGAVGVERSASINRSGGMGIPKLRQAAALHTFPLLHAVPEEVQIQSDGAKQNLWRPDGHADR
jgi:hypothetical protein